MVVVAGDSLWLDIPVPNYKAIDDTWSDWGGSYDIAATVTGTSIVSGDLIKVSDGVFGLRLNINNSAWTNISVGTYKLMVQITNTIQGYREEKHDNLRIVAQGL